MDKFRQIAEQKKAEAAEAGVLNTVDLYELTLDRVLPQALDITLMPCRYASATCYHNIYIAANPNIVDIELPDDFKVKQIKNKETLKNVLREYENLVDGRRIVDIKGISQTTVENCLTLVEPALSLNSSNVSASPFYKLADKLCQTDDPSPVDGKIDMGITLSPKSSKVAKAFVPTAEMIPAHVREALPKPGDIITLFEQPELEAFMMTMGSMLVGPSGSVDVCTGEKYSHGFRQILIIHGEPKTGKSVLLIQKLANEVLPLLGYTSETLTERGFSETFGLARPVSANLCYVDDLDENLFKAYWLNNAVVKTVGSQGFMQTQEKNKDSVKTKVKTRVIGCINNFSSECLQNADDGVLNRIWLAQTRARSQMLELKLDNELADKSPIKMPHAHIEWLAEQLEVKESTILIWFLRQCVDLFLTEVKAEPSLNKYCTQLTSKFRFQAFKNPAKSLALASIFAHKLFVGDPGSLKAATLDMALCQFARLACSHSPEAHEAKNRIKAHWESLGRPYEHPWTSFRELDLPTVAEMASNLSSVRKEHDEDKQRELNKYKGGQYEKLLAFGFAGLRTESTGDKVIASPSAFKRYWSELKPIVNTHFTDLINELSSLNLKDVTANYNETQKPGYDSKTIADKLNEQN